MILISHRGNTIKSNPEKENDPEYLFKTIGQGFDVETDLWLVNNKLSLGHDKPQYTIELEFLKEFNDKLWIHCKNIPALNFCLNNDLHCFFHNTDDVTLTSKGYIWTYPNNKLNLSGRSIAVMPETVGKWDLHKGSGICSDNVMGYLDYV